MTRRSAKARRKHHRIRGQMYSNISKEHTHNMFLGHSNMITVPRVKHPKVIPKLVIRRSIGWGTKVGTN